jgi:hypothetical protein
VFTGGAANTTELGADDQLLEPTLLDAVTMTTSVVPTSPELNW